jgi:hypothetical protein
MFLHMYYRHLLSDHSWRLIKHLLHRYKQFYHFMVVTIRLLSLCAPKISFNIINKQTRKTPKMFKLHYDTERLEF